MSEPERKLSLEDQTRMMLASAGLIAGITLGSIAISAGYGLPGQPGGPAAGQVTAGLITATEVAATHIHPVDLQEVVAMLTGMDLRDVEWQRTAGQSLLAIAAYKGIPADDIVTRAVEQLAAELEADVVSGRITADQRARVLEAERARLTARMALAG